MKYGEGSRPYRMVARARAVSRTSERILAATVELWREGPMDTVTLDTIAERARVSTRTVIRRFGSREGIIEACIRKDAAGVRRERTAAVGEVDSALSVLIRHYEEDGDAVLRTLAVEERLEVARMVVTEGRKEHRAWCERVFAPFLPPAEHPARERLVDAAVAATDIHLWKLFRRDLGRPPEAVQGVMRTLLTGALSSSRL